MLIFVRRWAPKDTNRRDTSSEVIAIIEDYESLVWTERFQDVGDFELTLPLNQNNVELLKPGRWLEIAPSMRIMVVEIQRMYRDSDGSTKLKVEGKSLENHMAKTILGMGSKTSGIKKPGRYRLYTQGDEYTYTSTTSNYRIKHLLDDLTEYAYGLSLATSHDMTEGMAFLNLIPSRDRYPTDTSIWKPDTIPQPPIKPSYTTPNAPLLDAVLKLCRAYGVGFRWGLDRDENQIHYNYYTGQDLFDPINPNKGVVFDVDGGNWIPEEDLYDYTDVYNVISTVGRDIAGVSGAGSRIVYERSSWTVYPMPEDTDTRGFEVKALYVPLTSEEKAGEGNFEIHETLAEQVYNEHKPVRMSTGHVPPTHKYEYDVDYSLGDLVAAETLSGSLEAFRVTEQIFISDKDGVKAYPTLTLEESLIPGVWASERYDVSWGQFPAETWAQQP